MPDHDLIGQGQACSLLVAPHPRGRRRLLALGQIQLLVDRVSRLWQRSVGRCDQLFFDFFFDFFFGNSSPLFFGSFNVGPSGPYSILPQLAPIR
jgi:hypothetical protein